MVSDFPSWAGFLGDGAPGARILFTDAGRCANMDFGRIPGIHRAAVVIGRLDRAIQGIARSVGVLELKITHIQPKTESTHTVAHDTKVQQDRGICT